MPGGWRRPCPPADATALRVGARKLGASVELCYLDVPLDELWRRIHARGMEDPPIARSDLDDWFRLFQAPEETDLRLYDLPAEP